MVGLDAKIKALMDLFVSVARLSGVNDDDVASELINECGFTTDEIARYGHEDLVDAYRNIGKRVAGFLTDMPPFGNFRFSS